MAEFEELRHDLKALGPVPEVLEDSVQHLDLALERYSAAARLISAGVREGSAGLVSEGVELTEEGNALFGNALELLDPEDGACPPEEDSQNDRSSASSQGPTPPGFSPAIRSLYMSECIDYANDDFCGCMLDELEKILGEDEFLDIALAAAATGTRAPPAEFVPAMMGCLHFFGP